MINIIVLVVHYRKKDNNVLGYILAVKALTLVVILLQKIYPKTL
jgi:hypothetical protein